MNKMKKILAVLCIAIAVVMCLPNLKFLSRAGSSDYEEDVKVEYGGSVTLTPDLNRLPSDFKDGKIEWSSYEHDMVINGNTCTVKNITNRCYIFANIYNKNKTDWKEYCFNVSIENGLALSIVGDRERKVAYGETTALAVKASCKKGKLTYKWSKKESGSDRVELLSTGNKITTDKIIGKANYYCTVSDEYGNAISETFAISVDNRLSVKAVGDTEVIADSNEKLTLKVKASCKTGKLTYRWEKSEFTVGGSSTKEVGTGASITCKAPKNTSDEIIYQSYTCTVTDKYGNEESVEFHVYVVGKQGKKKLDSNKIYIIGGDADLDMKKLVEKKYPEYKKNVEYINLGMSGIESGYYATVMAILEKNPNVTIMVAMDASVTDKFLSTGVFTDMDKLGLTEAYSRSYPYTRKAGTYKGKLTAVAPYVAPGTFMYDPDIAKKVLGTSDPDKVQKMISTADGYLKVAAKMKKAGYYMTSGASQCDEEGTVKIQYGMLHQMAGDQYAWFNSDDWDDNKTYMLSAADKKIAKKIAAGTDENGYDTGRGMWTTEWVNDMNSGKVFGWFSCSWAAQYSIVFDKPMAVCQGPISYCWGGTYFAVKSGKKDETAAQFLKAVCCDPDVMSTFDAFGTFCFPNNTVAMKNLIKKGKNPKDLNGKQVAMKGKQNLYEALDKMARSINGGSYKISKPKVSLTSNGIVKGSDGKYYYVKKGLIQSAKSGFFKVGKKTYYIKKGVMQNKKTGFVKNGKKYYYVKKGVCSTKNEFVKVGKKTYYLNKGAKNTKTGFVKVGKATYYVKNGLKTSKTAFIKNGKKECYVKKGVWKKSYTGNVTYRNHVYYVKKGVKVKKVR